MLWNCGGFLNFTEKVCSFFSSCLTLREVTKMVSRMLISCRLRLTSDAEFKHFV